MSFPAADDLKERVREATDIVALIGSHLQLEPRGSQLVALCPFHDDTNPSLRVNPDRQSWKCWACDAGGDVFSFVMRRENVDFPGALRILAEQAGIEWKPHGPKATPGSPNDKATLYKAMAWAELQFHRCLLESTEAAAAREYLQQRHINADSIELYRIGYAPNEWQWLSNRARSTSWTPAVLEALGLVIRKDNGRTYDRFRGRVMFPIRDTQNRPIAVGGRILPQFKDDSSAKYINSPETRLYTKATSYTDCIWSASRSSSSASRISFETSSSWKGTPTSSSRGRRVLRHRWRSVVRHSPKNTSHCFVASAIALRWCSMETKRGKNGLRRCWSCFSLAKSKSAWCDSPTDLIPATLSCSRGRMHCNN